LNEQYKRTITLRASDEYQINYLAGAMEMVQNRGILHDGELDEETLITIEAQVKAVAEELVHLVQEQLVETRRAKEEPSSSTQKRRDVTYDRSIFRASQ
jgi:hypothetical protein